MSVPDREAILADVLELVKRLAEDWEYSGEISADTLLFADLGFESIDAVVLSSFIQERYEQEFPFPQFLAELGRKDIKDIRLGELIDFIHLHLNRARPAEKP